MYRASNIYSSLPAGATAVVASSGNVANAQAVATLAGAANMTTYISGFTITATGATVAAAVTPTVTGVIGGVTLSYTVAAIAGVNANLPTINVSFPYPIPASGTNTSIVVTLPALGGGNTNATVSAYGFRLPS